MDPITLIFYAVVCGILSLFAPHLGGRLRRLAVGAGVGVIAASALPYIAAIVYGS
ncbi:MAG: hypothetical protein AAGK92_06655 [Pseudomonadota bacterium]